jgi:hypothetical protein
VLDYLRRLDESELRKIGALARQRVLACHTAEHRAQELEDHVGELLHTSPLAPCQHHSRDTMHQDPGMVTL